MVVFFSRSTQPTPRTSRPRCLKPVSIPDIRQILTEDEKKHWHQIMSNDEFDGIFGPRTHFEEGGPKLAGRLAINAAFYGGLINTPKDAVAYAKVIIDQSQHLRHVPEAAIRVEERSEVWHVELIDPRSGSRAEAMSFSRMNGKVLSGDL